MYKKLTPSSKRISLILDACFILNCSEFKMAGRPGFEPELLGPEPRVLPLNYLPMLGLYQAYHAIYFILSRFFPFASNFIQKNSFHRPAH